MARLLTLLVLIALSAPGAWAQPIRKRPSLGPAETRAERVIDLLGPEHVLREAWRTTGRYFYDRKNLGPEWTELRDRYTREVAPARTPREVYAVVNRMRPDQLCHER